MGGDDNWLWTRRWIGGDFSLTSTGLLAWRLGSLLWACRVRDREPRKLPAYSGSVEGSMDDTWISVP